MLKLEAQVIARNPDFDLQGRDFLNHIDFDAGTVDYFGTTYPLLDCDFPTVDPAHPTVLTADEGKVIAGLVRSFAESERLQRHVQFLYAHGAFYTNAATAICSTTAAVPMTENGAFAAITFEGDCPQRQGAVRLLRPPRPPGLQCAAGQPCAAGWAGLFVVSVVRGKIAVVWPRAP